MFACVVSLCGGIRKLPWRGFAEVPEFRMVTV